MLATVASFLAGHALAMLMLSVGLRTESSILFDLDERWRVLARTFVVVWLAVPLLALAVLYLVQPAPIHAATMMVIAICPGVPLVVHRARKAHGDPKTTLLILIATALTALVMIPWWVAVLSRFTRLELAIGLRDVAAVLLPTILVPFVVGRLLGYVAPRIAKPLAAIAQALFVVGLAIILIAVIWHSAASFRELGARELVAALLIPVGAAGLGYWAGRPAIDDRISTTYAAALGNPALALAVIAHSYEIKLPAVIAFVVLRGVALLPFNLWFKHGGDVPHRPKRKSTRRAIQVTLLALAGALLTGSCATATTSIETSWQAPTMRRGELGIVVTMFPFADGALRRTAEDSLARELVRRSMRVAPAYAVVNPELRDREAIRSALLDAGFDGIITMRVVAKEERIEYHPTFDLYWGEAWGPEFTETIVRVEISAYSLITKQLVWSAVSRSVDGDDLAEILADIADVVGHELDRQGVIARVPGD